MRNIPLAWNGERLQTSFFNICLYKCQNRIKVEAGAGVVCEWGCVAVLFISQHLYCRNITLQTSFNAICQLRICPFSTNDFLPWTIWTSIYARHSMHALPETSAPVRNLILLIVLASLLLLHSSTCQFSYLQHECCSPLCFVLSTDSCSVYGYWTFD